MGFDCLGQYADKYYLLDIQREYSKGKERVFGIVWDNTKRKEKRLIISKNGRVRINNESIDFYALNG